jgi:hypothetical protein
MKTHKDAPIRKCPEPRKDEVILITGQSCLVVKILTYFGLSKKGA